MLFIAILLWLAAASNGPVVAAFQSESQAPLIDNERVRVWDIRSVKALTTLPGDPSLDSVVVAQEPASVAGQVIARAKGIPRPLAPTVDATHVVVIEVKEAAIAPMKARSGYPTAFPRPGSRKVFESDRVLVWDYVWTPGQPTPMHFHDKDVVVVYLETGDLRSTSPDNEAIVNHYEAGTIKFNPRDRVHTELLVAGRQRAIITELK